MTPGERQALKDIIRQFKNPEDSDFDAALNVIASHAKTIRALQDRLDEARRLFEDFKAKFDEKLEDTFT